MTSTVHRSPGATLGACRRCRCHSRHQLPQPLDSIKKPSGQASAFPGSEDL